MRFILLRDEAALPDVTPEKKTELNMKMKSLVENEITLTKDLYALVLEDSRIGFEATNHYYYVTNDLLEKIVNCRQILSQLQ